MVISETQKFPLTRIHSAAQLPKSKYRSLRALALIFALTPLINVIPSHANHDGMKKAQSQSIAAQTAITHSTANKTHFSSDIKKHLCSLGKLGTIVFFICLAKNTQSLIEKEKTVQFTSYYALLSAITTIIGLGKSIVDDYKSSTKLKQTNNTSSTAAKVLSITYALGKINQIALNALLIHRHWLCENSMHTRNTHFLESLINASFIGAFGKSLYNDYKTYKHSKKTDTVMDQSPVASVPVKTTATHA